MKSAMAVAVLAGVLLMGVRLPAEEAPAPGPQGETKATVHEGKKGAGRGAGMRDEAYQGIMAERLLGNAELCKNLQLSAEQIATIKAKLAELKKAEAKLNGEVEAAAMEQTKEMVKDSVSEEAVMAAIEKIGGIRIQLAKLHAKRMLVLKQNLTPEQMAKIKDVLAEKAKARKAVSQPAGIQGQGRPKRGRHTEGSEKDTDKKVGTGEPEKGGENKAGADQGKNI